MVKKIGSFNQNSLDSSISTDNFDYRTFADKILAEVRACTLKTQKEEDLYKVVNVATACRFLDRTRQTLNNWEKAGRITPIWKGRRKFYWLCDLVNLKERI